MPTQAIIFDREKWTPAKAREWLESHNYKPIKRVHTTKTYYRYRISDPVKTTTYSTIPLKNGIKLVVHR